MRLAILETAKFDSMTISWSEIASQMVTQGVSTVMLVDAQQSIQGGVPFQLGEGCLPRDGTSTIRADNPLLALYAAFQQIGMTTQWAWSMTGRNDTVEHGVGMLHIGQVASVWQRQLGRSAMSHMFNLDELVVVIPQLLRDEICEGSADIEMLQDFLHGQMKPMLLIPPVHWLYRLRQYGWVRCDVLAQQKESAIDHKWPLLIDFDGQVIVMKHWRLAGKVDPCGLIVSLV